jgi:hypothetical protein
VAIAIPVSVRLVVPASIAVPVSIRLNVGRRRGVDCRPHFSVFARQTSNERPVGVGVEKFQWTSGGNSSHSFYRGHLAEQRRKLSIAERLASQRTLGAVHYKKGNLAVCKANGVSAIGHHRGQKSIDSWHLPIDDRGSN